jgi:AsmA protein
MRRLVVILVALFLIALGILIVAPGVIPVKAFKPQIEARASEALGRKVTIGDDLRFRLLPQTAFRVANLEIANAEGFDAPYLARVRQADVGVKLMPLFKKEVVIDRFVLTEPDINLAKAKDGRVNWNLASSATPSPAGEAPQARDVRLGDVRIVDGKAAFTDAAAKKTYNFDDVDLGVKLASLKEPLEVDGTLRFEGVPSKVSLVLTSLSKIMAKEPASLKLDLELGAAEASADLDIETKEALSYSGPVSLNAPDLPAFAKLMGATLADAPGFDTLAVEGQATGSPSSLRLSGAKLAFDAIDATGDVNLSWGAGKPKAKGRLAARALDLRPYLPPPPDGPQGFPAWSDAKIDFTSLRNIDADFDLTAEQIFLNDLKFGQSRMKLKIEDGRMVADIPELGMYEGAGSGQLVVNARQSTPSITGKFDVGSVNANPLTVDLMKMDKLLGLGGFKLEFAATGSTQAAIMRSMDGSGGFDVADGALKGVNLGKLAKAVDDVRKGGLNPSAIQSAIAAAQRPDEKTDFSEFLSNFTITDGLISAPTIELKGPFVTMTGTGEINLPSQTLDLRLAPRAATSIDAEAGRSYAIPVRVTGTFSQPKLSIDAEALLRGRVEEGLSDFLGKAFKKDQSAGGGTENGTAAPEEEPNPARDILEGIIKPKPKTAPPPTPDESGTVKASEDAVESPEEALIKGAIGGIFGTKTAKPAEEPAPDNAEDAPTEEPAPLP